MSIVASDYDFGYDDKALFEKTYCYSAYEAFETYVGQFESISYFLLVSYPSRKVSKASLVQEQDQ